MLYCEGNRKGFIKALNFIKFWNSRDGEIRSIQSDTGRLLILFPLDALSYTISSWIPKRNFLFKNDLLKQDD